MRRHDRRRVSCCWAANARAQSRRHPRLAGRSGEGLICRTGSRSCYPSLARPPTVTRRYRLPSKVDAASTVVAAVFDVGEEGGEGLPPDDVGAVLRALRVADGGDAGQVPGDMVQFDIAAAMQGAPEREFWMYYESDAGPWGIRIPYKGKVH